MVYSQVRMTWTANSSFPLTRGIVADYNSHKRTF